MRRLIKPLTVAIALSLAAGGCGSGGSNAAAPGATSAPGSIATSAPSTSTSTSTSTTTIALTSTTQAAPSTTVAAPSTTTDRTGGGPVAAGAEPLLLAAVERSDVQTLRMAMFMETILVADGESFFMGSQRPLMEGVQSGDAFDLRVDMGAMFDDSMLAEFGDMDPADLVMEMKGNAEVGYIRSPLFSHPDVAAEYAEAGLPPLGDGWFELRVDEVVEIAGDLLPEDVMSQISGQQMASVDQWFDLALMADLVDDTATPSEVRGVPTMHYQGTVTLRDLLAAEGLESFTTLAGLEGDQMMAWVMDEMLDVEIILGFDIDDEGLLRAESMLFDMTSILRNISEESGETVPEDLVFTMYTRIELFDFSPDLVEIEFPDPSEITGDLTEWVLAALELVG